MRYHCHGNARGIGLIEVSRMARSTLINRRAINQLIKYERINMNANTFHWNIF